MVSDANACRISHSNEDEVTKTSLQFFFFLHLYDCRFKILMSESFELMAVLHLDSVSALPINILNLAIKLKMSH